MRYLSVCSGIEAASVAWHPLGWTPIGFSEIEPFPSAVLAHHYPKVKNYGDMSKFRDWSIRAGDIDLLVGGTPCQSFSIAGLRQGLKDPRGNLMLTFLAIAEHLKPKWIVWENVPGVLSSNGGKDFGSFLGGLGELGYGFAYRILDAQWCRTHGHPRAVPQRRRRVFVVGCLGDHISPAKVLFEQESMLRHSATRGSSRKGTSADVAGCLRSGGDGGVPSSRGEHLTFSAPISSTLNASFADKQGLEDQHALNGAPCFVIDVPIYCGSNPNASDTVTSKWQKQSGGPAGSECGLFVLQPYNIVFNDSNGKRKDRLNGGLYINKTEVSTSLTQAESDTKILTNVHAVSVAYSFDSLASNSMKSSNPVSGCNMVDVAKCIDTSNPCPSKNQGGIAVAVVNMQGSKSNACVSTDGSSYTINAMHGHDVHAVAVASTMQVRRLTPTECERLQGFPDGWTAIPWKKKDAEDCPDGPRYKALGNSMAVNCMEWLGERIQKFDQSSLCQLP